MDVSSPGSESASTGSAPTGSAEPLDELRVSRGSDADAEWLVLHGALDLSTMPVVEREVQRLEQEIAARPGAEDTSLGVDLSQLAYIDSSGVRVVLLTDRAAQAGGRRLAVRLGDGPARTVFDMLDVTPHLHVVDPAPARRGHAR
jgi:anti-anti-sigma factor